MINKDWMVYVPCATYNHAPYIKDALDGICMQQTSFPFVCGVIDDASTDGESEVLRQYLENHFDLSDKSEILHEETDDYERIFARHKVNNHCFFVVVFLKYNHYSIKKSTLTYVSDWRDKAKYVAPCEGDDFWIVPNKLQMQVEFLEEHPDFVLCHTDFEATKKRLTHYHERFENGNYMPGMIQEGFMIGTLTVMFRMEAYKMAPKSYLGKGWPMSDKPLWYELASIGKVKYFPIVTAMYRILRVSASHSGNIDKQIRFKEAGLEIKQYYAQKNGISLKNGGYTESYYSSLLRIAFVFNNPQKAEEFYNEAKGRNLLSIWGKLYYWGIKSNLFRVFLSLFVK